MIEKFLTALGIRGGSLKNFANAINEDDRKKIGNHWYYLTPIKITNKPGQLYEATIEMAFPFIANQNDVTEKDVFERINFKAYEDELIKVLKKYILVPDYDFKPVPFWSNDDTLSRRTDLKNFAGLKIHILNAKLTVQYRDYWVAVK